MLWGYISHLLANSCVCPLLKAQVNKHMHVHVISNSMYLSLAKTGYWLGVVHC